MYLEILDCGDAMPPPFRERLRNGSRVLDFDPGDIQSLPESGMGLQIIHEIMDEVDYRSDAGVNRLSLMKSMAPAPEAHIPLSPRV